MYKYNRIGPFPITDIKNTSSFIGGTPLYGTFPTMNPYVYIGAGQSGSFIGLQALLGTVAENATISYGLVLDSPESAGVGKSNFMIEYSVNFAANFSSTVAVYPFIGLMEPDYEPGWNAANVVNKFHMLPAVVSQNMLAVNSQALVASMQGGENIIDQNIVIGCAVLNYGNDPAGVLGGINISAKYATTEVDTYDKLR